MDKLEGKVMSRAVKGLRTKIAECMDMLGDVLEEEGSSTFLEEAEHSLTLAYWDIDEIIRPRIYDEESGVSYILEEDGTQTPRREV